MIFLRLNESGIEVREGDFAMNKLEMLMTIKKIYENSGNILNYFSEGQPQQNNDKQGIMISYDFQAGSYIREYYSDKEARYDYLRRLANTIDNINASSILECGVGEATILVPLLSILKGDYSFCGGFDISWSRIAAGTKFTEKEYKRKTPISMVVGDMFSIPCSDNSYDIVYTRQAIEPNKGKEKELLEELYRVTNKYLILIEPAYDLASEEARRRMEKHGYVQELYNTAISLGYNIITWDLYGKNEVELNPVGIMIIEKNKDADNAFGGWSCPWTKTNLYEQDDCFFSTQSLLAYPKIAGIPILMPESAIVATHFSEFT